ncbi:MAG: dipeptidase [Anaerolineae bacterium]|nr:dipeptidase [Anaerolineae bacterium]
MTTPHEYAQANAERFREQYKELIRIPSISTLPDHAPDVQRAAEWLAEHMRQAGFETAEIIKMPEGRHPLVLGQWNGAGPDAPTVLLYCHYDVQPAVVEDGWVTPPFEPTEKGERLYARGAVDSKLHVMSQLKACESLLQTGGSPVNLKLILEGEEESGSENINAFVDAHGDRLRADYCAISDGTILDPAQPSLVYALRGIIAMELHVSGPAQDLHSGHYGGSVHNPIQALAEIIAQLHDANGTVTVPGFYDAVIAADADERAQLAKANEWTEREWQRVAHAPQPWGEAEYNIHERVGLRPTLELNGITGGFTGPGFKTVLPQKAMAKISCRLVADQDPDEIFDLIQTYLAQITPPTVRSELIKMEPGAKAAVLGHTSRAMQAAARAYEQGWGARPIFERAGGSIPITYTFQKVADEVVIMGFGYKSGQAHGPNENIYLHSLHRGIDTAIYFLQEVGAQ